MTQAADDYFFPGTLAGSFSIQEQGSYVCGQGRDEQGEYYYASPLFDSVEGLSPSGTDYRALGCSRHSLTIKAGQKLLLSN